MQQTIKIGLAPEVLDEGSPEERAAFGMFTIRSERSSLTEGFDAYLNGFRAGPLVSGYHAAEWFAWNWWRLRFEPRSAAKNVLDWSFAHRMNSIGEGYVWPNLTIFSDGLRTALIAEPSSRPDAQPFRYVGALPLVVPSSEFEAAIDAFIPRIIGRLREQAVAETNLDRLWRDLLAERGDPALARRRRLEALLGRDAEEAEGAVEALIADEVRLGAAAIEEVAAEAGRGADILTFATLRDVAMQRGQPTWPRDGVRLGGIAPMDGSADRPAWRIGAAAAKALREQERWGDDPIVTARLAAAAGASEKTVTEQGASEAPISFVLQEGADEACLVLRGRHPTSRRFDLARLIGDRLMAPAGALQPATRAYTYRQKAQRAFAAELLAPFEAVDDMLDGDYSPERQQDVADHFDVSPMVIDTLLKNHGRTDRGGQDYEIEAAAAA
jgi:hypothetical protein